MWTPSWRASFRELVERNATRFRHLSADSLGASGPGTGGGPDRRSRQDLSSRSASRPLARSRQTTNCFSGRMCDCVQSQAQSTGACAVGSTAKQRGSAAAIWMRHDACALRGSVRTGGRGAPKRSATKVGFLQSAQAGCARTGRAQVSYIILAPQWAHTYYAMRRYEYTNVLCVYEASIIYRLWSLWAGPAMSHLLSASKASQKRARPQTKRGSLSARGCANAQNARAARQSIHHLGRTPLAKRHGCAAAGAVAIGVFGSTCRGGADRASGTC